MRFPKVITSSKFIEAKATISPLIRKFSQSSALDLLMLKRQKIMASVISDGIAKITLNSVVNWLLSIWNIQYCFLNNSNTTH